MIVNTKKESSSHCSSKSTPKFRKKSISFTRKQQKEEVENQNLPERCQKCSILTKELNELRDAMLEDSEKYQSQIRLAIDEITMLRTIADS